MQNPTRRFIKPEWKHAKSAQEYNIVLNSKCLCNIWTFFFNHRKGNDSCLKADNRVSPHFVFESDDKVFCGLCCSASWWILDCERKKQLNEWLVLYFDYMNMIWLYVTALCVCVFAKVVYLLSDCICYSFSFLFVSGMETAWQVLKLNNKGNVTNIWLYYGTTQCNDLQMS